MRRRSPSQPWSPPIRNDFGATEIAQFLPVLYVLFLIVLLPIIDFVAVFIAAAVQYLATNDFVAKAATQTAYASALNSMANEALGFQSTGFAKLVNMAPKGGYVGCGDDLYVLSTKIGSGQVMTSPANFPLSQTIDTSSNMYEMSVKSVYNVGPLVSFSSIPIFSDVPGLGKPMTLTFSASRPVEHPGGLQAQAIGQGGGGGIALFSRTGSLSNMPPAAPGTWRVPNIYQLIQQSGQTVVAENVVKVAANAGEPGVNTGLSVQPGQSVWLDTQSTGVWSAGGALAGVPTMANVDANGYSNYPTTPPSPCPTANMGTLCGNLSGNYFPLGIEKLNYPPPGAGSLSLVFDDGVNCFSDNVGFQYVRVIIVQ